MADYQPIHRELAKKSLILSDVVLVPGIFSVPDRDSFWNIGIGSSHNPKYGQFALVMSNRNPDGTRGDVKIYSKPIKGLDTALDTLRRERAILQEVGYNVK